MTFMTSMTSVRRSMCGIVLAAVLGVTGLGPAAGALAATPSAAGLWTCRWAPTMDQNWHNDALCTNGVKQVRPYLRPKDTHITRDELMASARAWARARNQHHHH